MARVCSKTAEHSHRGTEEQLEFLCVSVSLWLCWTSSEPVVDAHQGRATEAGDEVGRELALVRGLALHADVVDRGAVLQVAHLQQDGQALQVTALPTVAQLQVLHLVSALLLGGVVEEDVARGGGEGRAVALREAQ